MPVKCGFCESIINRQKPGVSYGGRCKNSYHISCTKLPSEMLKLVSVPGFSWTCINCQNSVDVEANFSDEDKPDLKNHNNAASSFNNILLSKIVGILTEIKGIKQHQAELTKSVQFCSDKIDDLKKNTRNSGLDK